MLLPFYIMRYEKSADIIEKDSEKLQRLLSEYEDIRNKLGKEISISGRSELYTDLNRLIIRISDYVFRNKEKVRKGVGEVMGGKVLQLESERLREEGMAIGKAEGKAEGEAEGRLKERLEIARKLKENGFSIADIVRVAGLSAEEIDKL